MHRTSLAVLLTALGAAMLGARPAQADVRLPAPFTDHMVLQRGVKVPVWGRAEPGEAVTVTCRGQKATATADDRGRWRCEIGPLEADGKPADLIVAAKATVTLRDVLVGDVWLCSGQDHMAFTVDRLDEAEAELAKARYPAIRLFRVKDAQTGWQPCTPETVGRFSAVGYAFGCRLHKRLDVPIGLVDSSEAVTTAEAWMSREGLRALPRFRELLARMANYGGELARHEVLMKRWWKDAVRLAVAQDAGSRGARPWADPALETRRGWWPVPLPRDLAKRISDTWRPPHGVVWFRKTAKVPAALGGKALVLRLDHVDDGKDAVYFDGVRLERQGAAYAIPAALAKGGERVVAVRLVNLRGRRLTFVYAENPRIELAERGGDGEPLPLSGEWLYRAGVRLKLTALPPLPTPLPPHPRDKKSPNAVFAPMIQPLVPFALRGVIWYQGQSNATRAFEYRTLFPALIRDWRRLWGRGDLAFLFVQLGGCARKRLEPGDDIWAELREAQAAALAEPTVKANTAMAVAIDLGRSSLAPDRREVARRLALAARAVVYGDKALASGPVYEKMTVEGDAIRLRFTNVADALVFHGGDATQAFAIAGKDRKFVWAQAAIDGGTVVVSSGRVPKPVAVRYAWEHTPGHERRPDGRWVSRGLLFNKDGAEVGLPAPPFRTDDWPLVTQPKP